VSGLIESVQQTVLARQLLRRGQTILVAVSGGLDSMVLFHVFHSLASRNRWRLVVAHFNHRLRARESDADERFVRGAAKELGLRFIHGAGDAAAMARREKLSVEMAARKLRHEFLARAAKRLRIKTIALAHHADDQVELFFLRLLRGAGGEGLAGMKWHGPSPNSPAIELVRPLLGHSKAALRRFADEQRIGFREDATNAQHHFLRNRIRHKLLPLLTHEYQPAIRSSVLRTIEIVTAETDFVRCAAEEWLSRRRRRGFDELPLAIQRRAIRIQLIQMGVEGDFDLIEKLRLGADRAVSVNPALTVYRDPSGRIASRPTAGAKFKAEQVLVEIVAGKGGLKFGGLEIEWRTETSMKGKPRFATGCENFDADKVGSPIIVRHWRRGDRFQPIGMRAPVKLQDLLVNRKVPREQRHQLVVATTEAGEIFWVEGLRMAERFKLDKTTIRRLIWRWFGR
jgi:tRNA(Ile)-lysidine synthase